jgi:RimJ/RimL family protein N-acetyltransferase
VAVLEALREADLDDLVAVQREGAVKGLGHIFPQNTHPFPTDRVRERWAAEISDPRVDCFAIMDRGRLAGFAATKADEFLHFGTAVDTWGTGLAGQAHDELLEHLRGQGLRRGWLSVFDENHRAIRFYCRRGWTATDLTTRSSFPPYPALRRYEIVLS